MGQVMYLGSANLMSAKRQMPWAAVVAEIDDMFYAGFESRADYRARQPELTRYASERRAIRQKGGIQNGAAM